MKNVAMVTGLVLIAIGVAGYLIPQEKVTEGPDGPVVETKRSVTALIPAFVGAPIVLCGLIAIAQPESNKMAMHVAVLFGLLGAVAATSRGVMSLLNWIRAEPFNQRAFVFTTLMGIICWIFVIMCVMSFIKARKSMQEADDDKESTAGNP